MLRWYRRSLIVAGVLAAALNSLAVVNVEWVNENTVVVSGSGSVDSGGDSPAYIITNVVGVCTNCTAVDPATIDAFIQEVKGQSALIANLSAVIVEQADQIIMNCALQASDISGFRHFLFNTTSVPNSEWSSFTNYVFTTPNAQTTLDRSTFDLSATVVSTAVKNRSVGYNNGIYDYANTYVEPNLTQFATLAQNAKSYAQESSDAALGLYLVAESLEGLEPCTNVTDYVGVGSGGSGGGSGGSGGGSGGNTNTCTFVCAWTEEQAEAVVEYLRHIDRDQHVRSNQLDMVLHQLGNVTNLLDSYGRAISSALWTDSTIIVDTGENSWSNVYASGYSSLYDYERSNILQRIELLVYGMALGDSMATNALDGLEQVDQEQIRSDFEDSLSNAETESTRVEDDFKTAGDALVDLGESMCFLGDGSISSWSVGKVRVGDWLPGASDEYLEVPSSLAQTLNSFRPFFRYGFQVLYLILAIAWCWIFYTRIFKYVAIALRYLFQFLNEAFG